MKTEEIRELRSAVSKLSPEDMELILMVYYSGSSLKTYAERKGLSYNAAVRKKKRILERLSRCMGKTGTN